MDNFYIDKILNGDKESFSYIITQYKDKAFNLAVSIVKDTYQAEEIVQESFIKCYKKLHTFKREAKFSSWLYRIVVNEAFLFLRKNKRELLKESTFIEHSIEQLAEENSKAALVQKAILSLPYNEALVLNLFYLEERKIKEIAAITGWTNSNIKVMLFRARKNIRKLLNQ